MDEACLLCTRISFLGGLVGPCIRLIHIPFATYDCFLTKGPSKRACFISFVPHSYENAVCAPLVMLKKFIISLFLE